MFLHISFKSQTVDNLKTPFLTFVIFVSGDSTFGEVSFSPHHATELENIHINYV